MYRKLIRQEIARQGKIGVDPRHVEAYMRLEHSTLDGLSASQFSSEVDIALDCIDAGGPTMAEGLAKSYGL